MAGRTPPEAVNNFLTPLQRALSCVTNAVLLVGGGYHVSTRPHVLLFQDNPVLLGHDRRFALKLIQQYRIVEDEEPRGPWKVSTVAYYYTVETPETSTAPPQEVFGYHWHPQERNAVTYPHLHLYQAQTQHSCHQGQ
jgi:hypothetical protein